MNNNTKETKEPEGIHKKQKIASPKGVFREYFESFTTTLIMAIFGMTFILQAVTVPTGSMQNTINIGDYLLVNKFIFAPGGKPIPLLPQREVERGDIIVFKYPGYPNNTKKVKDEGGEPYKINFVKRVIGMPGDKIEIKDNHVFVNGEILPEHRVIGDSPLIKGIPEGEAALETKEFEPRQENQKYDVYYSEESIESPHEDSRIRFGAAGDPYTVPENHYFVMGDSRDRSLDSRYWGPVDRDLVIGRAMFVYWSCDRGTSDGSMFSCITHPRFDRIGKLIK